MTHPLGRMVYLALALLSLTSFFSAQAARDWWLLEKETVLRSMNRSNVVWGLFLHDHTSSDTSVALHWAGLPIYFGERRGIDVLGMSDRHIAKLAVPRFRPGHSKWDWNYVINERRPDILLRSSRGVLENLDFRENYYVVDTPLLPDRFMVRKDSVGKLRGKQFRFYTIVQPENDAQPVLKPVDLSQE